MTEEKMKLKIQHAIDSLLTNDSILLENDTAERTITARLACYIQEQFHEWNVDCEYNRNHHDVKRLTAVCKPLDNGNGSSVYPDIIVHKRMTEKNLIVIEVKKTTNKTTDDCDKTKLKAFIDELGYQYGLFIRFRTGKENIGVENLEWI